MVNVIAPTIVHLNNCALSHFLNRDYETSIDLLRRAYEVFEGHARQPCLNFTGTDNALPSNSGGSIHFMQFGNDKSCSPRRRQDAEKPSRSSIIDFQMDSTVVKAKTLRSSRVEPTCNYASSPGTAYSMYNRALVFSDQEDDFSLMVQYRHRTEAIILYNLALVHHTIGIQLGVSAALPHAIRLYDMALECITMGSSIPVLSSPSLLMNVQKLLLAILNNLGNIYTHLYESKSAQHCFQQLRTVLAATGPMAPGADEDYTFFFLNAVFQGTELCFAPAA